VTSPVRQLIDARRPELMARLDELEHLRAQGRSLATWPLEFSLLSDEEIQSPRAPWQCAWSGERAQPSRGDRADVEPVSLTGRGTERRGSRMRLVAL
jgi:hypothetical protein